MKFGKPAIDQTEGGVLYFGGGDPYGYAFSVSNVSPRLSSFLEFDPPLIDGDRIETLVNNGPSVPITWRSLAPSGLVPDAQAIAALGDATEQAVKPGSTILGIDPTLLLIGGGLLLAIVLMK